MNPLDVTGAFVRDPAILERSLAILGEDPGIALRFCSINLPWQQGLVTPTPPMLDAVGAGLSGGQSPGLLVVQTLKPITDLSRELMKRHRIPGVIGGLDHAVRAAARACWWSARYRACTAST